jgi:hypothetical protein
MMCLATLAKVVIEALVLVFSPFSPDPPSATTAVVILSTCYRGLESSIPPRSRTAAQKSQASTHVVFE